MSDAPLVPNTTPQASELVALFLSGRTEATLRAYRRDLEDFRAWVGSATLADAAQTLLTRGQGPANALTLAYRANLQERKLQSATINRRIAALRSLVKLARLMGHVPWSLDVGGVPHESYRDTRGPGRDGVRQLFAAIEGNTPAALRDNALLHLLYDLGLRRGEAVALDRADVEADCASVWVRGKRRGDKERLTLPKATRDALSAYLALRGNDDGPLFLSFDRAKKGDGRLSAGHVYKIVRALGDKVGVRARPHGLRHTAITEACKAAQNAGIGLEEVLDFSRHKSIQVLMVYRDRERNVQGTLAALIADDTVP